MADSNTNYSKKLNRLIPGGAHTYSRGDDQFPQNAPQILAKGQGAYVWDPGNNRYLDYGMALRAVTLGYGNESVNQAAIEQIRNGNNLTRASVVELEAAELLIDLIPSSEMVKFAKNGSTVTTAAVKLARAYTGKKLIARCFDHPFFSFDDWFIGDTVVNSGIPDEISALTVNFRYNDLGSLNELFERYPDQIACVIMEPVTSSIPIENYLSGVKDMCVTNNCLFVLDEMITGFRFHLQGAQTLYNIEPDLSTFGKGMANGFSVAALTGKKEIMELGGILNRNAERVFLVSTTHGAEMSGLGAFIQTVDFYKKNGVIQHLWDYGGQLKNGMNDLAKEFGLENNFIVEGFPCSPVYTTLDTDGKPSPGLRTLFSQEMIRNNVLMPWIALSFSHQNKELELTLNAVRNSFKILRQGIEDGYEKYLLGESIKPVFRRYN